MTTNIEKGNNFEYRIASLYEFLGFKTYRNREIQGQQIDIIAEREVEGVGEIRLIIECKYLSKGSVANQIIYDFKNFISSISNYCNITKGIIVTNRSFSMTANSAIGADTKIELRTENELEKKIFDLRKGYLDFTRSYESDWIFNEYVPLKGCWVNTDKSFDLEEYLDSYIAKKMSWIKPRLSFLSIFGDFGSGKTTILKRIFYKYSAKYLDGTSDIKPFFFELKHFYRYKNLDLFIAQNLKSFFYKDLPLPFFWKEVAEGKAILLLDGFDEMAPQVNKSVRMDNFLSLSSLLATKSPCLITCRPSYFISSREYSEVFRVLERLKSRKKIEMRKSRQYQNEIFENKIDDIYLQLKSKYIDITPGPIYSSQHEEKNSIYIKIFSTNEIKKYLSLFDSEFKHKCNSTYLEVLAFLERVYDLSELMSKPLLLKMIKDTILELGQEYKNLKKEIGPHYLYELYTQLALDIEKNKGETRQFLESKERKEFAEAIALAMFEKEALEVEYYEILEIIRKTPVILNNIKRRIENITLEEVASDIQICSFITRTDNDTFKFVHKSFMEFFIARILKDIIYNKNYGSNLLKRMIPKEIIYFTGSYIMHDKTLSSEAFEYFRRGYINNPTHRRNIASIILLASVAHKGLNLENVTINHIDIKKSSFVESIFKNIDFDNIVFSEIEWRDNSLEKVNFIESEFNGFNAKELKEVLNIYDSQLNNSKIQNEKFLRISSNNSVINNSELITNQLEISGNIELNDVTLKVSEMNLNSRENGSISFNECNISAFKFRYNGNIRFIKMPLISTCILAPLFPDAEQESEFDAHNKSLQLKQCNVRMFKHTVDSQSNITISISNSTIKDSNFNHNGSLDIKSSEVFSSNLKCRSYNKNTNEIIDTKFNNTSISIYQNSKIQTYEDSLITVPIISGNYFFKSSVSYFSYIPSSIHMTDNNFEDSLILGINSRDEFFEKNKLSHCRGIIFYKEGNEKNINRFNWGNQSIIEIEKGLHIVNINKIQKKIKFKDSLNNEKEIYEIDYMANSKLFSELFSRLEPFILKDESYVLSCYKNLCLSTEEDITRWYE